MRVRKASRRRSSPPCRHVFSGVRPAGAVSHSLELFFPFGDSASPSVATPQRQSRFALRGRMHVAETLGTRAFQTLQPPRHDAHEEKEIVITSLFLDYKLTCSVEAELDGVKVATASNSLAITPNSKRNLELDLDFLEKRQNAGHAIEKQQENLQSPIEISPESVDRVKVILLGAPAVGKTSIIQQFVWNDFCEDYQPTDRKHTYYPSVITNERLYEIKISDLPVIPYFPVNSYYEWTDFRFYGLRSATAYVLVFDLSNVETFQYIKTLREQISESRNMSNVPVLVVGNKQDLINEECPSAACSSMSATAKAITGGPEEKRRDIANLVKKHWKCGYVECSAKYNWKVVAAFKELISMIDSIEIRDQSPILDNIQDALDRNKCVIL